ncbi:hypothetical protein LguiA_034322 [Lonicera macranthoides]
MQNYYLLLLVALLDKIYIMAGLRPIDLVLSLDQESYWRNSTKELTKCDVDGSCRLLWPTQQVEGEVLRCMDQGLAERCRSNDGVRFEVEDLDTNTKHHLVLKRWVTNSFVFTTNWKRDFVDRRKLVQGDVVGLLWDGHSKFYFSLRRQVGK